MWEINNKLVNENVGILGKKHLLFKVSERFRHVPEDGHGAGESRKTKGPEARQVSTVRKRIASRNCERGNSVAKSTLQN